jgi:hypothetical protein
MGKIIKPDRFMAQYFHEYETIIMSILKKYPVNGLNFTNINFINEKGLVKFRTIMTFAFGDNYKREFLNALYKIILFKVNDEYVYDLNEMFEFYKTETNLYSITKYFIELANGLRGGKRTRKRIKRKGYRNKKSRGKRKRI